MEKIDRAIAKLKEGGIICFPTDTVYGLGVDAQHREAVERLYALKGRSKDKTLILFPRNRELLLTMVEKIPFAAIKLMRYFWPGPLTIIFEAAAGEWPLVSKEGKIGVRVPAHPVPSALIGEKSILLATTSANVSGEAAVDDFERLSGRIKEGVDLIVNAGPPPQGIESTIVDVSSPAAHILRKGGVNKEKIREVLEEKTNILFVCSGNMCRSVMAEYLFRNLLPSQYVKRVNVVSAGTGAMSSSPPSSRAVKVLRGKGIDATSHRSKYTSPSLVEQSDLILVMQKKHLDHLKKIYPQAKERIFMLTEFTSGKREEIMDPIGQSDEFYEQTCQYIEEEIKKLLEKLGADKSRK